MRLGPEKITKRLRLSLLVSLRPRAIKKRLCFLVLAAHNPRLYCIRVPVAVGRSVGRTISSGDVCEKCALGCVIVLKDGDIASVRARVLVILRRREI